MREEPGSAASERAVGERRVPVPARTVDSAPNKEG